MKTDLLTNLSFQTVTLTAKMVSSAFSFVKELSSIKNDPASLLFPKKSFMSASETSYPEELDNEAKVEFPDLNIHAWRAENKYLTGISYVKNMMGINGINIKDDPSSQSVIDKMKGSVDQIRNDSDNKISKFNFELNSIGFLERDSSKVVYRVDSRSPVEIVDNNGFGPSLYVEGILPMVDATALITSASLKGSNKVFHDWGFAKCSYQYAINSEGVSKSHGLITSSF